MQMTGRRLGKWRLHFSRAGPADVQSADQPGPDQPRASRKAHVRLLFTAQHVRLLCGLRTRAMRTNTLTPVIRGRCGWG